MSEVVKLQLIGLSVVGIGIVILLFIRAQFARVIGFVAIVLGLFSLVALAVPQMASLPPAEEKFDIATVKENRADRVELDDPVADLCAAVRAENPEMLFEFLGFFEHRLCGYGIGYIQPVLRAFLAVLKGVF